MEVGRVCSKKGKSRSNIISTRFFNVMCAMLQPYYP